MSPSRSRFEAYIRRSQMDVSQSSLEYFFQYSPAEKPKYLSEMVEQLRRDQLRRDPSLAENLAVKVIPYFVDLGEDTYLRFLCVNNRRGLCLLLVRVSFLVFG